MHPEDIKAAIRKRHGTMAEFERARGLAKRSVTDVLRGKPSRPTAKAIAAEVGHKLEDLFPGNPQSAFADNSSETSDAHRQNAEAK